MTSSVNKRTLFSPKLRYYQRQGVAFLIRTPRALLADEMGLGKTIQVLVAINLLLQNGQIAKALVITPASLKTNWEREARQWAPSTAVKQVQGDGKDRRTWYGLPVPVLIASYEQVRSDFYLHPPAQKFDLVVLDEAQRVKSPKSATTISIARIITDRLWALTGTPLENRSADLETILRILRPEQVPPDASLIELHEAMQGIFLRRRKRDVLPELPDILETELVVDLTPQQRQTYDAIWDRRTALRRDMGEIFAVITKLKQICNWDPSTNQSAKLDGLASLIEEVTDVDGKLLIFSQYVETLKWLSPRLSLTNHLFYGGLSMTERDEQLEWFGRSPGPCALLVSLRVGGVGLNIPDATHIVLFDRWWNPALEDQAINRAHRYGRVLPLTVVKLLAADTIEERIAAMLADKRIAFQRYVEGAPISRTSLRIDDLYSLLDLPTIETGGS